jgi:hypothetical protein
MSCLPFRRRRSTSRPATRMAHRGLLGTPLRDAHRCRPRPSGEGAHVPRCEPRRRSSSRRVRRPARRPPPPRFPSTAPSPSRPSTSRAVCRLGSRRGAPRSERGAPRWQLERAHAGLSTTWSVIGTVQVTHGIRDGRDQSLAVGAGADRNVPSRPALTVRNALLDIHREEAGTGSVLASRCKQHRSVSKRDRRLANCDGSVARRFLPP